MSEIAGVLEAATEMAKISREQRARFDEKSWDALVVTADGLINLLQQHETAIKLVVSPIVYDRDLAGTVGRYRELLRGVTVFSAAYEDAQGVLGLGHYFRQFQQGPNRNWIYLVSHRLGEFQWAAFSLHWSSGAMDNLLLEAEKLSNLLAEDSQGVETAATLEQQKENVRQAFTVQAFPSLRAKRFGSEENVLEVPALATKEDVVDLVRSWCVAWSDRITGLLYRGGLCGICGDSRHEASRYGLFRLLGQLKAAQFASSFVQVQEARDVVTILFLSADPSDAARLRLGEEFREIQEQLKLAQDHDHFKLAQPQMSLRPRDISLALLQTKPQIVHFSGHGASTGELYFENPAGESHRVKPGALAALFEQFSDQVECVVLNACFSEVQARAIAKNIKYVIGMNTAIGDKAAIAFATGFYQALGAGRPVADAYKLGCVQIRLCDIPEHLTPVLIEKEPESQAQLVA